MEATHTTDGTFEKHTIVRGSIRHFDVVFALAEGDDTVWDG
jgi:hypothetical protein